MERSRNSRGTFDARSCAFTIINTTENEYIKFHGIFERKERDDHISKMGKYEIRIPKPRILVQGILCGYGREECESDTRICSKSVKDRQRSRPVEHL